MGGGASGMFEVIMVTILVSMLSALMREFGGFDALLAGIKKAFKGNVGGQLGISFSYPQWTLQRQITRLQS